MCMYFRRHKRDLGVCRLSLLVAVVWSTILFPVLSKAQETGAPYEYIKGDRRTVRTQMQIGLQYAEAAEAILQSASGEQDLQKALALAKKSYVLWRYAWHGVEILYNDYQGERLTKSKDRMLEYGLKLIMHARLQNLKAQTAIANSIAWPESRARYLDEALQVLSKNTFPAARQSILLLN